MANPVFGGIAIVADHIGDRIRRLRRARGWSGSKLAGNIGISQGYLSDLENGKVVSPTSAIVVRLAEALATSSDYLLGRTDDPSPIADDRGNGSSLSFGSAIIGPWIERLPAELQPRVRRLLESGNVQMKFRSPSFDEMSSDQLLSVWASILQAVEDAGRESRNGSD